MALTITIEGKGVIANADAETNDTGGTGTGDWGFTGSGGVAWGLTTDTYLFGSSSMSMALSGAKNGWMHFDRGAGNELNFGTSGAEEGQHIYIWYHCPTIGLSDTRANAGVSIRIGTSTTAFRTFVVAGSDGANGWDGGWRCFVVDPTKTGSISDTGTYDTSSIRYIGIRGATTAIAKGDNFFVDQIAVGFGLRISGTSTTAWKEAVDYCTDYANRAWGMLQQREGIYYAYGKIWIGNSTQTAAVSFTDTGRTIQFGVSEYWSGSAWVPFSKTDYQGIIIEDASTYPTTFQDGVLVGSDAGRSGSSIIGNANHDVSLDMYGGNEATSLTKLYGTSFRNIKGAINFGNDPDHHMYSVAWENCSQVDPVGAIKIRNCFFIGYTPNTNGALLWNANMDIQDCRFIANTDPTNDPHGIEHPTAGTFAYTGMFFSGNDYDINNTSLATLMDSYQPTEDGDVDVYSGSIIRVAQQFTASAGILTRATFSLRKQGTPSGVNVFARLYANSGAAPTGAALATSNPIAIENFATSFGDVEFEFEDEYTLSATDYHISVEFSGGDASNRLEVEYLTAGSGSETCNTYISSWGGQTYDCRFAVNRGGLVKINATDSNPNTARETASVKGATKIVNTVNITIKVQNTDRQPIQDAQTSVKLLNSPYTQLMNEDTLSSGLAVEGYNYTGDVDVVVSVRKSDDLDNPRYKAHSSVQTISDSGLTLTITLVEQPLPI